MSLTEQQIQSLPKMNSNTNAIAGKDTLLLIALTKDPTQWILIGGQRNTPLSQKAESIDATSKDSGDYTTKIPGMLSWTSNYEGLMILDDTGREIMEDRYRNRQQAYFRQEYPDGSYRTGWAAITQYDEDHGYNGVSTVKINLEGAGEISDIMTVANPTIDKTTGNFTTATPADITGKITPADAFVRSIKTESGEALKNITDYTYIAGTLTIKKEYFTGKSKGAYNLYIHLTKDDVVKLTVTVA